MDNNALLVQMLLDNQQEKQDRQALIDQLREAHANVVRENEELQSRIAQLEVASSGAHTTSHPDTPVGDRGDTTTHGPLE